MPSLFGEKLRTLRRQHGLTQVELSAQLSLASYTHITKLEAGQREPSLSLIIRIAKLFGVTTDYLLRDAVPIMMDTPTAAVPGSRSEPSLQGFGAVLRSLRLKKGISQTELARQLSLASRTHINNLEAERKIPSPELALQIAELFGVTTDYLLLGIGRS